MLAAWRREPVPQGQEAAGGMAGRRRTCGQVGLVHITWAGLLL